ncbi:MAG: hypothetical protein LUQ64_01640 [Methanomicrobiales archaeon]|nr:hypothetical protein [Methanomicrobiales archaeon]
MQSTHHAKRTLHRRRVADPYARDPSLPDLSVRAAAERASGGYLRVSIPLLVIVAAVLLASPLFAVEEGLAELVIVSELGLAALIAFMGMARNRTIADITETTGREGYQRILAASAHYRWVGSVYGLTISTATAILALVFFRDAVLAGLAGAVAAACPAAGAVTVGELLLLLVAFRLLQAGTDGLRYRGIRSLPETRDYAALNRRFLAIDRKDRLIRYVPAAGVAVVGLFLWHGILGLPMVVPLAGAGILLLFTVITVLVAGRERMPRVKAQPQEKERPSSTPRAVPTCSQELSRNSPPPPPLVATVHPPVSDPPGPAGTGTLAVINRDTVNPDGEDFEPWW